MQTYGILISFKTLILANNNFWDHADILKYIISSPNQIIDKTQKIYHLLN